MKILTLREFQVCGFKQGYNKLPPFDPNFTLFVLHILVLLNKINKIIQLKSKNRLTATYGGRVVL